MEKPLSSSFYQKADVVTLARELLGKHLVTHIDGTKTSGMIIETEAYDGIHDKACHAYGGRKTKRTEVMYEAGGIAYVYLCYGIHHLFNVITNKEGIPDAVLIRGIIPEEGMETILARRNKEKLDKKTSSGPGTLTQALGITTQAHNKLDLTGDTIWIEDHGIQIPEKEIQRTPRIGIDYAGPDAELPYRFILHDSWLMNHQS